MGNLARSAKTAFRSLLRRPAYTLVTVLILTLGIGANTAIFSLLNAIVLRPLPIPHPEELVRISTAIGDDVNGNQPLSLPIFDEIARARAGVTELFAWNSGAVSNLKVNGKSLVAAVATVSGNYYQAVRIAPFLGRFIQPADVAWNSGTSDAVAVISYRAWRNWYQSDPKIIGRTIRIENQPFTVIGVEPKGYSGLIIDGASDVTVPVLAPGRSGTQDMRNPRLLWLTVYGRMLPGLTITQARARLEAAWPHIQQATMPPGYEGARKARFFARRIVLESAAKGESFLRNQFSQSLRVLLALVGAVLLIACLNLANLALARGVERQHETAVRAAMGASAWELACEPFFEGLILSSAGALLGLAAAYWTTYALLRLAWQGISPVALDVTPDLRVFTFAVLTAVGAASVFALAPVWFAARTRPISALKMYARSIRTGSSFLRRAFLVVQIGLSLMLVLGALLFGRTLQAFHTRDLGYRRDHLLTMQLFPQAGAEQNNGSAAYYRDLADALQRIPGVTSVSFSNMAPANEYESLAPVYLSRDQPAIQAINDFVGPNFFATAGMRVLSGREFTWSDSEDKRLLVIITQRLAEKLFGHGNAVGRTIILFPVTYGQEATVIGVVNSASLWKVETREPLAFFQPFTKLWSDAQPLVDIRTSVDPRSIKTAAEQVVRSLRRHHSLRTQTVNERLDSYIAAQRLTAILAGLFGSTGLLIAAVGLYGLISFQVARRVPELGVRIAIGAQREQIVSLVLREALVLAGTGCVLGLAGSLAGSKLIENLLFGVSANDPIILAITTAVLIAVSLIASYIPARRAGSIDPIEALRVE